MTHRPLPFVVASLLLLAVPLLEARAQPWQGGSATVQELYRWCVEAPNTPTSGFCAGYLVGLANGLLLAGDVSGLRLCSTNPQAEPLRRIFIAWAERNPHRWNDTRALGAKDALTDPQFCRGL